VISTDRACAKEEAEGNKEEEAEEEDEDEGENGERSSNSWSSSRISLYMDEGEDENVSSKSLKMAEGDTDEVMRYEDGE